MAWEKTFCFVFDDIDEGEFSLGWLSQNQTGKLSSQQTDKLAFNQEDKLIEKDR